MKRFSKVFSCIYIDYLLTGISSENKALHEELGLSESAITLMKYAKDTEGFESTAPLIKLLDSLLSDKDFYAFGGTGAQIHAGQKCAEWEIQ